MCGAVPFSQKRAPQRTGSSPRVRSGRPDMPVQSQGTWIISACAERSCCNDGKRAAGWDHLRVCGAVVAFDVQFRGG